MKKAEQREMNKLVEVEFDAAIRSLEMFGDRDYKQLRSCQAWVYETPCFYVLRSYGTFIAAIDKFDGNCYDALRREYGFTSTSAQHIAKFRNDYARRGAIFYTWRYVD